MLERLHDISMKLSCFCSRNPATGREIGVTPLFMTAVGDAMREVENAKKLARDAALRARLANIRSGDLPTYARRVALRRKSRVVKHK